MASPARTPPSGNHPNSADVLAAVLELGGRMERRFERVERRFEKVDADIAKLDDRLRNVEAVTAKIGERQQKQGEDIARLDGRVSQLPTLWQLAGLIFAIFSASFVLIRFAGGR